MIYLVCIDIFFVFLCQYFGHGIGCSKGDKAQSDGVTNYVTNEAQVGECGRRNSLKYNHILMCIIFFEFLFKKDIINWLWNIIFEK